MGGTHGFRCENMYRLIRPGETAYGESVLLRTLLDTLITGVTIERLVALRDECAQSSEAASEDQGYFFVNVSMPNGSSLERTQRVVGRLSEMLRQDDGVANVIDIAGFSLITNTTNPTAGTLIAIPSRGTNGRMSGKAHWGSSRP